MWVQFWTGRLQTILSGLIYMSTVYIEVGDQKFISRISDGFVARKTALVIGVAFRSWLV